MTITHDDKDLPAKILFRDASGSLVRRVTFVRDSSGRLLSDEYQFGELGAFPTVEKQLESPNSGEHAKLEAVFAQVFGPTRTFSTTNIYV